MDSELYILHRVLGDALIRPELFVVFFPFSFFVRPVKEIANSNEPAFETVPGQELIRGSRAPRFEF